MESLGERHPPEPRNVMLYDLLPHLLNGIALGLLFALLALGFMLIIGVMEVINLAHGSLFALGAYMGLVFMTPEGGLPFAFMEPYYALPAVLRYVIALVLGECLPRRRIRKGF